MPKAQAKAAAPKLAVGNRISFQLDDEEILGNITAINKDGSFVAEDDDGKIFEFEKSEAKDITILPEEPEEEEQEEEEEKKPAKKAAKKPAKEEQEEEEEEEKPAKKSGSGRSLAGAWRSAERAARGNAGFPVGSYEALVVGGEAAEGDKGVGAYLTFLGVNDPEVEGKSQRKYYNIIDADGNPQEQGISYMKADLHDMGIDDDDINDAVPDTEDMEEFIDALNKFLKKVGKMRPWVSIRVVPPKKTGYGNTI